MVEHRGSAQEIRPGVGSAYLLAWHRLWPCFWKLLLIGLIYVVIQGSIQAVVGVVLFPFQVLSEVALPSILEGAGTVANVMAIGAAVAVPTLIGTAVGVFAIGPLQYGVSFAYLKAARNGELGIDDMFESFKNYWSSVLANVLVGLIVVVGFILLVIPGIILLCKLAFTPYLVVDRRLRAVDAMKESWRMTRGHA